MAIYGNTNPYLALAQGFLQGRPMPQPRGLVPSYAGNPDLNYEGAPRNTLRLPFASPMAFAQTPAGQSMLQQFRDMNFTKSPNALPHTSALARSRRGRPVSTTITTPPEKTFP